MIHLKLRGWRGWLAGSTLLLVVALGAESEEVAVERMVAAAAAKLGQIREHYQARDVAGMAAAAEAGLGLLAAMPDSPEVDRLRGSLWYWSAVSRELQGDYDGALASYQRARDRHEASGNRREVAATLNSLANLHGHRGEQTERLAALVQAREIFEEIGEVQGRAAVANSLGNYYGEMGQFAEAQEHYEKSVALRRTMDRPGYLATGLQGLGVNLRELGRVEDAATVFGEALAIFRELEDPAGLADILTNLGNLARSAGRYEEALVAYREALGYDTASGYKFGEAILKHNLALTYQAMHEEAAALDWAEQAVDAADDLENPERREHAYLVRGQVRETVGDLPGALADARRLLEIREERQAAARDEALLEMQTKFETAEKQREIEQLEREAAEQELARVAAEQARELAAARGRTTLVLAVAALLAAGVLAALFRVSRRSERRLAQQRKEIERALAGLRAAHGELKRLYDRKSAWLGFAVHDLRSPLFAIDAVCGEIAGGLLAQPEEGVREIRLAAQRMREELDAWLEAERKEQTEIAVHPVSTDVSQLVTDVVALNRPAARAKEVALGWTESGAMEAAVDPWRWSEVIDNLVSNAIKFTPSGGRVSVGLTEEDGEVVLRVQDNGPGLSAEDRERLFGAYAQLSARPTAGEGSTGLGLHLVKRIGDAHGARIAVEDAPGGGAVFVVALPRAA